MYRMPENICAEILEMEKEDLNLTEQLRNNNLLEKYGYHPVLEKCHKRNSKNLKAIIDRYGFPTLKNSSPSVVNAAWRVVQHSIGEPSFMKNCFALFQKFSSEEIPLNLRAYLGDRIAFYERKPQKYGTQFDYDLNGKMTVWWLEDKTRVEEWRANVGLPPLKDVEKHFASYPAVSAEEAKSMRKQQESWLLSVGWCSMEDIRAYYNLKK